MSPRKPVTISLPPPLESAVQKLARKRRQTVPELVRSALRLYLDHAEREAALTRALSYGRKRAKQVGVTTEKQVQAIVDRLRHDRSRHRKFGGRGSTRSFGEHANWKQAPSSLSRGPTRRRRFSQSFRNVVLLELHPDAKLETPRGNGDAHRLQAETASRRNGSLGTFRLTGFRGMAASASRLPS